MDLPSQDQLQVPVLGPCRYPSPLERQEFFVRDDNRVLITNRSLQLPRYREAGEELPSFECAGPRERIFFRPGELTCGVLSCGGLSPGINDVIRSLTLTLHHLYGVRRILGFRYGFAGLADPASLPPIELTPSRVSAIHQQGGSILGTSRGPQDLEVMLEQLGAHQVGVLFAIGGDGTLRGAADLADRVSERGLEIAIVGVPKTIDNDLHWVEHSFGFSTAVEEARHAIAAAHVEAHSSRRGVGLVKLMGRHSGFIAAHATLSNSEVNFCLVPEVPFALGGERGLLAALRQRLEARDHAVIVAAEGAGQELFLSSERRLDASGNLKLDDIGVLLQQEIAAALREWGTEGAIKYIDPSYLIRGRSANAADSEFCLILGQTAAHAGLAGRTGIMVGYWNQHFTHVPLRLAAAIPKRLDPKGVTWRRVLDATGQPSEMV